MRLGVFGLAAISMTFVHCKHGDAGNAAVKAASGQNTLPAGDRQKFACNSSDFDRHWTEQIVLIKGAPIAGTDQINVLIKFPAGSGELGSEESDVPFAAGTGKITEDEIKVTLGTKLVLDISRSNAGPFFSGKVTDNTSQPAFLDLPILCSLVPSSSPGHGGAIGAGQPPVPSRNCAVDGGTALTATLCGSETDQAATEAAAEVNTIRRWSDLVKSMPAASAGSARVSFSPKASRNLSSVVTALTATSARIRCF